ncbi:hypothetical protein [Actinophytocola sp. KF-1]
MARAGAGDAFGDPRKWLAIANLLVSLGVLPKTWQKGIGTAAVLLWLYHTWR